MKKSKKLKKSGSGLSVPNDEVKKQQQPGKEPDHSDNESSGEAMDTNTRIDISPESPKKKKKKSKKIKKSGSGLSVPKEEVKKQQQKPEKESDHSDNESSDDAMDTSAKKDSSPIKGESNTKQKKDSLEKSSNEPKAKQQKKKKKYYVLFLGNLPYRTTEDEIREHFIRCGKNLSICILNSVEN